MMGERLSQYARSESQPGSGLSGLRYLRRARGVRRGSAQVPLGSGAGASLRPRRRDGRGGVRAARVAAGLRGGGLRGGGAVHLESSSEVECAPMR